MAGGTQWSGTGMVPGSSQRTSSAGLAVAPDRNLVSAVGRDFQHTLYLLPVARSVQLVSIQILQLSDNTLR